MSSCVKLLNAIHLHTIFSHTAKNVKLIRQCATTVTTSRLVEVRASRPKILAYVILENISALKVLILGFLTSTHKYDSAVKASQGGVFKTYDLNIDICLSDSSLRQIRELSNLVWRLIVKCE